MVVHETPKGVYGGSFIPLGWVTVLLYFQQTLFLSFFLFFLFWSENEQIFERTLFLWNKLDNECEAIRGAGYTHFCVSANFILNEHSYKKLYVGKMLGAEKNENNVRLQP